MTRPGRAFLCPLAAHPAGAPPAPPYGSTWYRAIMPESACAPTWQ